VYALTVFALLAPGGAAAQPATDAPSSRPTAGSSTDSRLWLVAGTAFATLRGDCQTCEAEAPYRHSGSLLANAGYRVSDRMDVGAEVFWVPTATAQGRLNTTHIDAVAQFRPWRSQGFFLKGGAGMAFVRNWVDTIGPGAINSKALSVVVGAGWSFRPAGRIGLQVFGSQHAAALGDLKTANADVPDVMGNFWSFGAAIAIR
jgi:hypothetical protein